MIGRLAARIEGMRGRAARDRFPDDAHSLLASTPLLAIAIASAAFLALLVAHEFGHAAWQAIPWLRKRPRLRRAHAREVKLFPE